MQAENPAAASTRYFMEIKWPLYKKTWKSQLRGGQQQGEIP